MRDGLLWVASRRTNVGLAVRCGVIVDGPIKKWRGRVADEVASELRMLGYHVELLPNRTD